MAWRVEIGWRRGAHDARGEGVKARARRFLHLPVSSCVTREVYSIDVELDATTQRAVREAFADPVLARAAIGRLSPPAFDWLVEVGFKPGVTDNVGRTAGEALADVLDRPLTAREGVYTATQYFLRGRSLERADVERLARDLLANTLIQTVRIFTPAEWRAAPIDAEVPRVHDNAPPEVRTFDLSGSDEDLLRISREGILSLSLEEMHAIRDHFNRPETRAARTALGLPAQPTDVELECIAQTWSEHCKHKIFSARIRYRDGQGGEEVIDSLFATYIRGATAALRGPDDGLVSVFSDNAGIVRFNERFHLSYKVETHNSPSALDPYGGAITGIVGVNRDPLGTGMGCELLANVWGYCLGSPFYDGDLPEGLMHPRRIRDGVHQGVIDGGNQSGIPWLRGFERFDDRYIGKPLVYCGTVGRIPVALQGRPSERKEIEPGDAIVMCGGRIGKDGIHGATFSSEELRHESPAQAVQIGDPITQRKLYEFLIEARDLGLYRALTDNGAGGLSSSLGEMARLSGGAEIDTARAPLKYEGLQPWEILLSEAQERMSLAVQPENLEALFALAKRRDVEAVALGTFTDSGAFVVRHGERVVGRLDMAFLHDGCPRLELEARWTPPSIPAPRRPKAGRRDRDLLDLLASLDVCSREYKSRQYDGEVKGLSVIKPFVGVRADVPSDASVMRVEYGAHEGLALAEGILPFYADLDTYAMTAGVVDEAVRRIVSVGGRLGAMYGLDNFCWPDPVESAKTPDGAYKLAQLVRSNKALYDTVVAYRVPLISGKDSMKNDSVRGGRKISIPPTLLFSTLGHIADVRRCVTMPFKRAGDLVYVLGMTRDELGGSAYCRGLAARRGRPEQVGGRVPEVDPVAFLGLYRALSEAIGEGLIRSSHTPTVGGLGVAFALAALGGELGVRVQLGECPAEPGLADHALLFAESHGRFVVTCAPEHASALERVFAGLPMACVGEVRPDRSLVLLDAQDRTVIDMNLDRLRAAFTGTLHGI